MRGKIKFYNVSRRFGFIVPDDGSGEMYFNEASLPRSRRFDPVEGDLVEFETRAAKQGRIAHHITVDPDRMAVSKLPDFVSKPNGNGHARDVE